jgi:hypothetical protein
MEKPQNFKNTKSLKKQKEIGKEKIQDSPDFLSKEMLDELEKRYLIACQHPEDGSSWEEVKLRLQSKE